MECPTAAMCGAPETAGITPGSRVVAAMAQLDGRAIRGGTVARPSHERCSQDDGPSPSSASFTAGIPLQILQRRPRRCEIRGQNVVAALPFPTRLRRSGLNRLRERWLILCLIAQLVGEGDWLTRRSGDVVRSAGGRGARRPDIDTASPTGGPSAPGRSRPSGRGSR